MEYSFVFIYGNVCCYCRQIYTYLLINVYIIQLRQSKEQEMILNMIQNLVLILYIIYIMQQCLLYN